MLIQARATIYPIFRLKNLLKVPLYFVVLFVNTVGPAPPAREERGGTRDSSVWRGEYYTAAGGGVCARVEGEELKAPSNTWGSCDGAETCLQSQALTRSLRPRLPPSHSAGRGWAEEPGHSRFTARATGHSSERLKSWGAFPRRLSVGLERLEGGFYFVNRNGENSKCATASFCAETPIYGYSWHARVSQSVGHFLLHSVNFFKLINTCLKYFTFYLKSGLSYSYVQTQERHERKGRVQGKLWIHNSK